MGKNVININEMAAGERGTGRHWTIAEVQTRKAATEKITRKVKKLPKPPEWLSVKAKGYWKKTIADVKDLDILDLADSTVLAVYCDAMTKYIDLSQEIDRIEPLYLPKIISSMTGLLGQINSYADKLGLTPTSRARLAKKMADGDLAELKAKQAEEAGMFGD